MVDQPTSRRSFLFGRRLSNDDPWLRFLARVKRSCEGKVSLLQRAGAPMAHLEPARLEDVLHALTLCRHYGVCMALEGVPMPFADKNRPVLQVQAGRAWGELTPIGEGLWRVQAGCPTQVINAAGIALTPTETPVQNLAQWFAMVQPHEGIGSLDRYGIDAIEILYSDGSIEVLGQFGVQDSQPLRSMAAQRSIPSLFQLTTGPLIEPLSAQAWAANEQEGLNPEPLAWPLCFRLDALMNLPGQSVNLANLFLGHRASLGWVVAAHMREQVTDLQPATEQRLELQSVSPDLEPQYRDLNLQIKQIMDPDAVFLSCPGQTG